MKTKYFDIVDSCTKYFVDRRLCKRSSFLRFTLFAATCRAIIGREPVVTFPLRQWLRERTTVLRYTYVDCLVVNLFLVMQDFVPLHGLRPVDLS